MSTKNYIGLKYIDDRDGHEHCESDPETCVCHSELPEGTRVIHPDQMVTMDFNEDRLNLHVNEEGIVVRQRMG